MVHATTTCLEDASRCMIVVLSTSLEDLLESLSWHRSFEKNDILQTQHANPDGRHFLSAVRSWCPVKGFSSSFISYIIL